MNKYRKYCPNVFIAECEEKHDKGDEIIITTKYGKENEHIIHNFLGTNKEGNHYYSITRADGFTSQERAKNRAERRKQWAGSASKKSDEYYNKSNKHRDFLCLGEPIKVGHHSEKRHRKIIEEANNNTRKSIELDDKAKEHEYKAQHWERMASKVDLSMPESIEFFTEQLKEAKEYHLFLKDNPNKRPHSMALQYANKKVKDLEGKVKIAHKLWSEEEHEEEAPKMCTKKKNKQELINNFEGLFWAFNNDQFKKGMEKIGLNEKDTDKILSIGMGGYIRKDRREAFGELMKA